MSRRNRHHRAIMDLRQGTSEQLAHAFHTRTFPGDLPVMVLIPNIQRGLITAAESRAGKHLRTLSADRIAELNAEWDAPDSCDAVTAARKHLASLSPERRAELEKDA